MELLLVAPNADATESMIPGKAFCEIYVQGLMDGASAYAFLTQPIEIANHFINDRTNMVSKTCTGVNNQNIKSRLQTARENISSDALNQEVKNNGLPN